MATPKLRFKEFSSLWKKNKFSECFDFHMTNSYSRAKLSGQGDVMNIHYGDIHTKFSTLFDVAKESVPFITSKTDCLKIKKDQFLRIGDLVIADASEDYEDIGKTLEVINLNGKQVVAGLHTYIARPNETYATGFFGHLMQTEKVRKQIKVLATGISVLGISKTNLNKLDLDLPSLPEQTKIATFLSAVDTKIDELTQKHELLTEYKKGIMQQIFSQKLRFKGFSASWNDIKVGSLGTFNSGGTPSKKNSAYWNGDIPWISSSDLTEDSIFEVMTTRYITREAIDNSATKIIPKNSVLIVSRVGVGKVAVNSSQLCTSQDFTSLTPFNDNPVFLAYLLKSKASRLLEFNQGTSIKGFVRDDLINLSVSIPTKEEQTKIANFLTAIDQKIDNVAEQIDHAKTWKKGLLQQMFV